MKHARMNLTVAALTTVACIAPPARAETLVVPWVGLNTGSGPNISTGVESGASDKPWIRLKNLPREP